MAFEPIHNEKELLIRIAEGDRDAFQSLYMHYFPAIQGYVTLFEPNKEYLDELSQDILVRMWEKREKLGVVEDFRGYLFLMARNTIFNYFRSKKVHRVEVLAEEEEIGGVGGSGGGGGHNPEHALLYKQYYNIVVEGIGKLSEGKRKVLKMSIDEGMTIDEIAEELQISRSGVKKQLYAATAFVRQYLLEHGEMTILLFVFLSLFEL